MKSTLIVPARPASVASSFFEGLSTSVQARILAASSKRHIQAHSIVTDQDEPADHLFLLATGYGRFFYLTPGGNKIVLFWVRPGDIFGGAALLLHDSPYLVGTETVRNCELIVWPRETIRALTIQYPRLMDNALAIASTYLTWYLALHIGLIFHDARQRLAQVLMGLANGLGQKYQNGIYLEVTNEQLASAANVTLFTASRIISEWDRMGFVTKGRGTLVLHPSFKVGVAFTHNSPRE